MHRRAPADHSLACRLERAEGLANAHYIDVRARLMPGSGARWIEVAGARSLGPEQRSRVGTIPPEIPSSFVTRPRIKWRLSR
jgi:hypothetical protein